MLASDYRTGYIPIASDHTTYPKQTNRQSVSRSNPPESDPAAEERDWQSKEEKREEGWRAKTHLFSSQLQTIAPGPTTTTNTCKMTNRVAAVGAFAS